MELTLDPKLKSVLDDAARLRGTTAEVIIIDALRERFLAPAPPVIPQDEWERRLLSAATDCGVSLPASALTSDGIYE